MLHPTIHTARAGPYTHSSTQTAQSGQTLRCYVAGRLGHPAIQVILLPQAGGNKAGGRGGGTHRRPPPTRLVVHKGPEGVVNERHFASGYIQQLLHGEHSPRDLGTGTAERKGMRWGGVNGGGGGRKLPRKTQHIDCSLLACNQMPAIGGNSRAHCPTPHNSDNNEPH